MLCNICGSSDAKIISTSDTEITYQCKCGEIYNISLSGRPKREKSNFATIDKKNKARIINISDYRK